MEKWAWFAGIFEGEGSIALTGVNSVCLQINMTDEDVIHRCHEIAGGRLVGPYKNGRAKPLYGWVASRSADVIAVLDRIEPHLGTRRLARATEARERLKNVRREGFCKRGHPMSGDNLYVSPKGERMCKACRRKRETKRRHNKREHE